MIARITGTIVEQQDRAVVLDTGAIGYLVYSPFISATLGDRVTLYTHLVIRDDAHELYGFATAEEKTLFVILIGVSGVGPKTALQMLMLYPIAELVRLVQSGDAKAISLVPGIGKKTAEKVIIDLKDKLAHFVASENVPSSDLVEALLSLGYRDIHIRAIITTVDCTIPLEKQIAIALQLLQK